MFIVFPFLFRVELYLQLSILTPLWCSSHFVWLIIAASKLALAAEKLLNLKLLTDIYRLIFSIYKSNVFYQL